MEIIAGIAVLLVAILGTLLGLDIAGVIDLGTSRPPPPASPSERPQSTAPILNPETPVSEAAFTLIHTVKIVVGVLLILIVLYFIVSKNRARGHPVYSTEISREFTLEWWPVLILVALGIIWPFIERYENREQSMASIGFAILMFILAIIYVISVTSYKAISREAKEYVNSLSPFYDSHKSMASDSFKGMKNRDLAEALIDEAMLKEKGGPVDNSWYATFFGASTNDKLASVKNIHDMVTRLVQRHAKEGGDMKRDWKEAVNGINSLRRKMIRGIKAKHPDSKTNEMDTMIEGKVFKIVVNTPPSNLVA